MSEIDINNLPDCPFCGAKAMFYDMEVVAQHKEDCTLYQEALVVDIWVMLCESIDRLSRLKEAVKEIIDNLAEWNQSVEIIEKHIPEAFEE